MDAAIVIWHKSGVRLITIECLWWQLVVDMVNTALTVMSGNIVSIDFSLVSMLIGAHSV